MLRALTQIVLFVIVITSSVALRAAEYVTQHFVILNAPNSETARQLGDTAERCRHELALLWLGTTLPDWREPCPISVRVGETLAPGGETSFTFHRGEVSQWEMKIQGSLARLTDSVLPHEVTHMIFADHFRRPLPRWFDEGGATCMEHRSEKDNYHAMLRKFLQGNVRRGLPFNKMVTMMQYPADAMPLYAQAYSVAEFLLQNGSHKDYVRLGALATKSGDWSAALREVYGVPNLGELQLRWVDWVAGGTVPLELATNSLDLTNSVYARMMEDPRTFQPVSPHTTERPATIWR